MKAADPKRPAPKPTGTDPKSAREALVHFASAFVFLVAGLSMLVWNGQRLADGAFSDGCVVGGLHFLTLGWLSLSIFGALRVFTGVALGSAGFSRFDLAPFVRYSWTLGAALFPIGLILSIQPLIVFGPIVLGVSLVLYTVHIVPALVRARRGAVTRWYLTLALISLWAVWSLGLSAAFVRAGTPLLALPPGYFEAHLLLAVFGWVGATVVGVGAHLVPMFALSRNPTHLPVKVALPLWATAILSASVGAFVPRPFLQLAWWCVALGSFCWIAQVVIYFQTQMRKESDPGLFLAAAATLLLGGAWIVLAAIGAPTAFIGVLVVGWLTLFTLGIYHRVVPFLVWYMRFARGNTGGRVPRVKELVDNRLGYSTAILSILGAAVWAAGLVAESYILVIAGSVSILVGAVTALGQLYWLSAEIPATPVGPSAAALARFATAKGGA